MSSHSTFPPLTTTSPVAVAANRILTAYLSRRKLSAVETAHLGAAVTSVIAQLAARAGTEPARPTAPSLPAQSPAPRPKRRPWRPAPEAMPEAPEQIVPDIAETVAPLPPVLAEPEAEEPLPLPPTQEHESAIEPDALPLRAEAVVPVFVPMDEPEAAAEEAAEAVETEAAEEAAEAAETEAAVTEEAEAALLSAPAKKRKRPSRPRSKRGTANAAASAVAGLVVAEPVETAPEPPVETAAILVEDADFIGCRGCR